MTCVCGGGGWSWGLNSAHSEALPSVLSVSGEQQLLKPPGSPLWAGGGGRQQGQGLAPATPRGTR